MAESKKAHPRAPNGDRSEPHTSLDLGFDAAGFEARAISPLRELGAYEALWEDPAATFKTLSEKFEKRPGAVPSEFVPKERALACAVFVREQLRRAGIHRFGVRVHGAGEYPEKLRDAAHPVELLYYQGWWDLVESPSVADSNTWRVKPKVSCISVTPGIRPHS